MATTASPDRDGRTPDSALAPELVKDTRTSGMQCAALVGDALPNSTTLQRRPSRFRNALRQEAWASSPSTPSTNASAGARSSPCASRNTSWAARPDHPSGSSSGGRSGSRNGNRR